MMPDTKRLCTELSPRRCFISAAVGLTALLVLWPADSVSAEKPRGRLFEPLGRKEWPRIVAPTIGLPAVVRPGDSLVIRIGTDQRPSRRRVRVRLARWDLRVEAKIRRLQKPGRPANLWVVEAAIPEGATCPLLYDLRVELAGRSLTQPNAVHVVPRFADDLTCIQITDTEINDRNPAPARRLGRAIREINLIAPDFVLASGDLTYDGRAKQFDMLINLLGQLDVPVFTQIGNADYHGDESIYFARINAYRDYVVDLGGLRVIGLDSGTNYKQSKGAYNLALDNEGTGLSDDQIAWFQTALTQAPPGSLRLAFMHFPAVSQFGNRGSIHFNRERFKALCERHRVALVLCGHTHVDSIFDQREKIYLSGRPPKTRPCYIQSATTSSHTRMPLLPYSYRMVRIKDRRAVSFTYDANGDGKPDAMRSVPVGKLDVQFDPPNDVTSPEVTATITNGLNEAFDRARLVFRVPSRSGATYRVDGGTLVCTVPDGKHHRVVVQARVPARATHVVRLKQR